MKYETNLTDYSEYKYAKLGWDNGGYAIIKDCKFELWNKKRGTYRVEGIFIFGSRRGYESSGHWFTFTNVEEVEELEQDYVVKEYFPGLL